MIDEPVRAAHDSGFPPGAWRTSARPAPIGFDLRVGALIQPAASSYGHGVMSESSPFSGVKLKSDFGAVRAAFDPWSRRDDPAVRSCGASGNWHRSALTEASRYL